jgi:heme exporter protein CcmD
MREFFAMGGYGWFVWPAYLLGFGVVILNFVLAWSSLGSARAQAQRRLEMSQ